jgi:hypothetical protein
MLMGGMGEIDNELREVASVLEASRPRHYYRDGSPIFDDETEPAWMKWAKLFEDNKYKIVQQNKTLYGERLSTVWLGLDHSFSFGAMRAPVIFETMLFAPCDREEKLRGVRSFLHPGAETKEQKELREKHERYIAKHFPHDQLQLRYTSEDEALHSHKRLWWACIVPPRWRAFLLGRVLDISLWKPYANGD